MLTTETRDVLEGIRFLNAASPRRQTPGFAEWVVLEHAGDKLTMRANNAYEWGRVEVPAGGEGLERVAVDRRLFERTIKAAGERATLTLDGRHLRIEEEGGGFKGRIAIVGDPSDVPDEPEFDEAVSLPAWPLIPAVSWCLPAVGDDPSRPQLHAVCVGPHGIAASDSSRLHYWMPGGDLELPDQDVMLPREFVKVMRLFEEDEGDCWLEFAGRDRRGVRITGPGKTAGARLLDGHYPDWRRILHDVSGREPVRFDAATLGDAVQGFAGLVPEDRSYVLRLDYNPDEGVTVLSYVQRSGGTDAFRDEVPTSGGAAFGMAFQGRFLVDVLRGIEGEILFWPDTFSTFRPADGPDRGALVAVVRV